MQSSLHSLRRRSHVKRDSIEDQSIGEGISCFCDSAEKQRRGIFDALLSSFLLLVALSHVGCQQSSEPRQLSEETSNGILPLKVGYYWQYETYALNEDSSTGLEIDRTNYRISRVSFDPSQKNSDALFHRVSVNPYSNADDTFEWLYRNYDDGLYEMGGTMPTDSIYTKLLLYKYPVQKGETWISPHLVYDLAEGKYMVPDSVTYTCVETSAVFETPLGSFSCIVYHHREKLPEEDVLNRWQGIYEYYSTRVGLVGIVTYGYHDSTQTMYPVSRRILVATNTVTSKP
jgi:hypothetical protein